MSTTQLVGIYELFRLGRKQGGGFDLNHKTKDRDLHPVHHSFAEESNANTQINGLLYVEDKEATKKYWNGESYERAKKEYTKFVDVPEVPKKELSPEIQEIQNKLSEMTKEQLIEFAEKNDYKIKKTKSAENILAELIEQIEVTE